MIELLDFLLKHKKIFLIAMCFVLAFTFMLPPEPVMAEPVTATAGFLYFLYCLGMAGVTGLTYSESQAIYDEFRGSGEDWELFKSYTTHLGEGVYDVISNQYGQAHPGETSTSLPFDWARELGNSLPGIVGDGASALMGVLDSILGITGTAYNSVDTKYFSTEIPFGQNGTYYDQEFNVAFRIMWDIANGRASVMRRDGTYFSFTYGNGYSSFSRMYIQEVPGRGTVGLYVDLADGSCYGPFISFRPNFIPSDLPINPPSFDTFPQDTSIPVFPGAYTPSADGGRVFNPDVPIDVPIGGMFPGGELVHPKDWAIPGAFPVPLNPDIPAFPWPGQIPDDWVHPGDVPANPDVPGVVNPDIPWDDPFNPDRPWDRPWDKPWDVPWDVPSNPAIPDVGEGVGEGTIGDKILNIPILGDILRILLEILKFLLGLISNLMKALMSLLLTLFVPRGDFFPEQFNKLEVAFTGAVGDSGIDFLNQIRNVTASPWQDLEFTVMGYRGSIKLSVVQSIADTVRPWIVGFFSLLLGLYNYNQLYFAIRGVYPIGIGSNKDGKGGS